MRDDPPPAHRDRTPSWCHGPGHLRHNSRVPPTASRLTKPTIGCPLGSNGGVKPSATCTELMAKTYCGRYLGYTALDCAKCAAKTKTCSQRTCASPWEEPDRYGTAGAHVTVQ
eukprot:6705237-Pyramimonas_sp.AAC.1